MEYSHASEVSVLYPDCSVLPFSITYCRYVTLVIHPIAQMNGRLLWSPMAVRWVLFLCVLFLPDSSCFQVMVAEFSQKLWVQGWYLMVGKLSWTSRSCLKLCTNCIGSALFMISSFLFCFSTEELRFLFCFEESQFCVYKGVLYPKEMYFYIHMSCFVT